MAKTDVFSLIQLNSTGTMCSCLPRDELRRLKWKKGDRVKVVPQGQGLFLKKVRKMRGSEK
jgi:hypothetical protein